MRTDALIEALSRDLHPTQAKPAWPLLAAAGALGLLAAFAGVFLFLGARPDLADALAPVALKIGYGALLALAIAPAAFLLAQPNIGVKAWATPVFAVAVGSLALAGAALVMTAPEARASALMADGFPPCMRHIPLLAAPVAVIMMLGARRLAPTRLTLAGAALGAFAGAIAALAYAFFCTVDSVPYVATWYLAAIALSGGIGAALGRWLLRW